MKIPKARIVQFGAEALKKKAQTMNTTTYERGIETGEARGLRRAIRNQLKRRFPKSKETFTPLLDEISDLARLDQFDEFAFLAKSMAEFRKVLKSLTLPHMRTASSNAFRL
jgi:hypothetical protein